MRVQNRKFRDSRFCDFSDESAKTDRVHDDFFVPASGIRAQIEVYRSLESFRSKNKKSSAAFRKTLVFSFA